LRRFDGRGGRPALDAPLTGDGGCHPQSHDGYRDGKNDDRWIQADTQRQEADADHRKPQTELGGHEEAGQYIRPLLRGGDQIDREGL
jgi:hypothetical protein